MQLLISDFTEVNYGFNDIHGYYCLLPIDAGKLGPNLNLITNII